MFTGYTAQDWAAEDDKGKLILDVVDAYKSSDMLTRALMADRYFEGHNDEIMKKIMWDVAAREVEDANGRKRKVREKIEGKCAKIPSNFLRAFVVQQNQHLLGNGVSFSGEAEDGGADVKARLGRGFDRVLAKAGEKALLHGVSYLYYNADHAELIAAAVDERSGSVALLDERTGEPGVLIQYWQLTDKKPMYVRVMEPDGVTLMRRRIDDNRLEVVEPKRGYVRQVVDYPDGHTEVTGETNYGRLPVVPLYGNPEKRSELTESIKAKIDAYDRILSDFGDNLDRANDVYWVLNNFGGTSDDVLQILNDIRELRAVSTFSDTGGSSSAEPRTIEVPYQARDKALDILKKALYRDFMARDTSALTGGSLTNVAIKVASEDLELKCDRYEWQVLECIEGLLTLIGLGEAADRVTLTRRSIANDTETVQAIYMAREDLGQRMALQLNPMVNPDDVETIIEATQAEHEAGLPDLDAIDAMIRAQQGKVQNPSGREDGDLNGQEPAG